MKLPEIKNLARIFPSIGRSETRSFQTSSVTSSGSGVKSDFGAKSVIRNAAAVTAFISGLWVIVSKPIMNLFKNIVSFFYTDLHSEDK